MRAGERRLTEPLETVTRAFGAVMILVVLLGLALTLAGTGASFSGIGVRGVCATQRRSGIGQSAGHLAMVRPGAYLSLTAPLQACTNHPTAGQRVLFSLTTLPTTLVWAGVVLLLWRMIRIAARGGPFTLGVASAMRTLAWFVMIGAVLVAAAQGLATDLLLNSMLTSQYQTLGDAIPLPQALIPVPLLVGAGLLTFARIIRAGAAMDEEIRATI